MDIDDPGIPEFASWKSYDEFARGVRHKHRYVWDERINAFMATVLATNKGRDMALTEGAILYRAQRGIAWESSTDEDGNDLGERPVGYCAARMKPRPEKATEGRANPAGLSVLYLGTTIQTSVSEVRPWIGAAVSVAQFKILRDLKLINLSRGHGKSSIGELTVAHLVGDEEPDKLTKKNAVWVDIDNAFSRPVTLSDDSADYVPTQILAELFKNAGYGGIVYKSQFGEKGYNVVLFNVDDADPISCTPHHVTAIEVKSEQLGDAWFSRKHLEEQVLRPRPPKADDSTG